MRYLLSFGTTLLLALAMALAPAYAGQEGGSQSQGAQKQNQEEKKNAKALLNEAAGTVEQMKADEELSGMLEKAKGIFIIPDYGQAAAVVGARGGQGVMLAQDDGSWSGPAFYNMGSISVGAQAGVEAGQLAMLLMTDKALESFKQQNNFSLNADAGFTIINWSGDAQASYGKGDVIVWSDTEGLLGSGAVSVSDINADTEANMAYYGEDRAKNPRAIIEGEVESSEDNRVSQILP